MLDSMYWTCPEEQINPPEPEIYCEDCGAPIAPGADYAEFGAGMIKECCCMFCCGVRLAFDPEARYEIWEA